MRPLRRSFAAAVISAAVICTTVTLAANATVRPQMEGSYETRNPYVSMGTYDVPICLHAAGIEYVLPIHFMVRGDSIRQAGGKEQFRDQIYPQLNSMLKKAVLRGFFPDGSSLDLRAGARTLKELSEQFGDLGHSALFALSQSPVKIDCNTKACSPSCQ